MPVKMIAAWPSLLGQISHFIHRSELAQLATATSKEILYHTSTKSVFNTSMVFLLDIPSANQASLEQLRWRTLSILTMLGRWTHIWIHQIEFVLNRSKLNVSTIVVFFLTAESENLHLYSYHKNSSSHKEVARGHTSTLCTSSYI